MSVKVRCVRANIWSNNPKKGIYIYIYTHAKHMPREVMTKNRHSYNYM